MLATEKELVINPGYVELWQELGYSIPIDMEYLSLDRRPMSKGNAKACQTCGFSTYSEVGLCRNCSHKNIVKTRRNKYTCIECGKALYPSGPSPRRCMACFNKIRPEILSRGWRRKWEPEEDLRKVTTPYGGSKSQEPKKSPLDLITAIHTRLIFLCNDVLGQGKIEPKWIDITVKAIIGELASYLKKGD